MEKITIVGLTTLLIIVSLCGCLNNEEKQSSMEEMIIGEWYNDQTWYNQETQENVAFTAVYEFFSNSSFFSGFWDSNVESYTIILWGTYEINNSKIYFKGEGQNTNVAVHEYYISDDGNTLNLYYEDGSGFDVFTKYV